MLSVPHEAPDDSYCDYTEARSMADRGRGKIND